MTTGAAQNKLGELFVDIGVGGVGKTLKALNSISATFLLTKNAAVQLAKPLMNLGKQALNNVVSVGKMSTVFGTTMLEYQKLVYYFKHHKLSEGLIEDLTSLSDKFTEFANSLSAPSAGMLYAFEQWGLDWTNYLGGTLEDSERLISDIQEASRGMDTNYNRMLLKQAGLNPEWLYAFQKGINFDEAARTISDRQVLEGIEAQEKLEETMQNLNATFQGFLLNYAPKLTQLLEDKLIPTLNGLDEVLNKIAGIFTGAGKVSKDLESPQVKNIRKNNPKAATAFKFSAFNLLPNIGEKAFNWGNSLGDQFLNNLSIPQPSAGKGSSTININNENHIHTNDANGVKNAITGIDAASIKNAEYNTVQASNSPSL